MSIKDVKHHNDTMYTYCPECGSLLKNEEHVDVILCAYCYRKMRPKY